MGREKLKINWSLSNFSELYFSPGLEHKKTMALIAFKTTITNVWA